MGRELFTQACKRMQAANADGVAFLSGKEDDGDVAGSDYGVGSIQRLSA